MTSGPLNLRRLKYSRLVPIVVLALTLSVLAGTVYFGAARLRQRIRDQLTSRDGQILYAVALAQQFNFSTRPGLAERFKNQADQLELALQISQLKDGVLAVRMFDPRGKFVIGVPANVTDQDLSATDLAGLASFRSVSHYVPAAALTDLFLLAPEAPAQPPQGVSLLQVNIPIHPRGQQQLLGSAQLILDARNLDREFAALDRDLMRQSLGVFLAGGGLVVGVLLWAYRRLRRSHALLQERTTRLLRANHELAMAAKTKALGAVTAHLIHGLSNPLADLQDFVATQSAGPASNPDWQGALASARRMQQLVDEAVRLLAEEQGGDRYEITLAELTQILAAKVRPACEAAGVKLGLRNSAAATLTNRDANLLLLIVENLLQNALQATPRGKSVHLSFTPSEDLVLCEVADEGPGLPPEVRAKLFTPCHSTKVNGSGIGLAISNQLARELGAQLALKHSGPAGTAFVLSFPKTPAAPADQPRPAAAAP